MPILGGAILTHLQIFEAIGANQDTLAVDAVALLAEDAHSTEGYGGAPLEPGPDPADWVYSYERWFRIQITGEFQTVRAFRIFCPGLVVPTGWQLRFGVSTTYHQPTNTPSAIATQSVPTTDPGPNTPNAGGLVPFAGPGSTTTDWIVLQARGAGAALPGPILGFNGAGQPVPLTFEFHWIEVD